MIESHLFSVVVSVNAPPASEAATQTEPCAIYSGQEMVLTLRFTFFYCPPCGEYHLKTHPHYRAIKRHAATRRTRGILMESDRIEKGHPQANEMPPRRDEGTADKPIEKHGVPSPSGPRSELQTPPSKRNKYKTGKKWCYTRDPGMFWIGTATLILVGIYAWYARQQAIATDIAANAAKKSAEAADRQSQTSARQLELAERPWVFANVAVASPLIFDANGAHITLRFIFKNTGHSPAVGVWVDPEFYAMYPTRPHPIDERRRLCNEIIQRSPGAGDTVFPGADTVQDITINMNKEDMDRSAKALGGFLQAAVIVCIAYRPTFRDDARYYTGMIYDIGRLDPAHPAIFLSFKAGENVPMQNLHFAISAVAGVIAQ